MSPGHCPDQERERRSCAVSGVAQRCLEPEEYEFGTQVGWYPGRRYVDHTETYAPGVAFNKVHVPVTMSYLTR